MTFSLMARCPVSRSSVEETVRLKPFFSEMRAVTTFLSLPLACGDDVRLGNPAFDVDAVTDGAGCADMATVDYLRRA